MSHGDGDEHRPNLGGSHTKFDALDRNVGQRQ